MWKAMLAVLALAVMAAAPPVAPVLRQHAILDVSDQVVQGLAFRPDGKVLATANARFDDKIGRCAEMKLWEVSAGKLRSTWKGHRDFPAGLAFSPDGKTLVSVGRSLERIHWNVATGKAERTLPGNSHSDMAHGLRFRADGKQVGVCEGRHTLVWDAVSGKEVRRSERKSHAWRCILSHDLRLAAVPEYQDVDLWDDTGKLVRCLPDHPGSVGSLSFSANDRLLAVTCTGMTEDGDYFGHVSLWDVPRGRRLKAIALGNLFCRNVALSPSGDLLAVGGSLDLDGPAELRLFETATGRELARLQPPRVTWLLNLTFRTDGKMLAASCDGTVRLWTVHRPAARSGKRGSK
jgi:WD40 repeat protein